MFLGFFNLLRSYGLKVSMQEWMSLMQALEMDLGNSTLTGFYHLCRCILVKSEADYDTLDKVFALYFKNIKEFEELPEDVWKWLADGEIERMLDDIPDIDFDDIGDWLNKTRLTMEETDGLELEALLHLAVEAIILRA